MLHLSVMGKTREKDSHKQCDLLFYSATSMPHGKDLLQHVVSTKTYYSLELLAVKYPS